MRTIRSHACQYAGAWDNGTESGSIRDTNSVNAFPAARSSTNVAGPVAVSVSEPASNMHPTLTTAYDTEAGRLRTSAAAVGRLPGEPRGDPLRDLVDRQI